MRYEIPSIRDLTSEQVNHLGRSALGVVAPVVSLYELSRGVHDYLIDQPYADNVCNVAVTAAVTSLVLWATKPEHP